MRLSELPSWQLVEQLFFNFLVLSQKVAEACTLVLQLQWPFTDFQRTIVGCAENISDALYFRCSNSLVKCKYVFVTLALLIEFTWNIKGFSNKLFINIFVFISMLLWGDECRWSEGKTTRGAGNTARETDVLWIEKQITFLVRTNQRAGKLFIYFYSNVAISWACLE